MLKDWEKRLESIFSEEPLSFPPMKDFEAVNGDPVLGMQLRQEVLEQQKWSGLNPGQNLGKAVPKGTQYRQ